MRTDQSKNRIILAECILSLLEEWDIDQISPESVARTSGLQPNIVRQYFITSSDGLGLVSFLIDKRVLAQIGKIDTSLPLHERLFDVLMTRFEALNQHKQSIRRLSHRIRREPELALAMYKAQMNSMSLMYQLATHQANAKPNTVVKHWLLLCFQAAFLTWENDSTPDLGQTMNTLDKLIKKMAEFHPFEP